jgi:CheY-like chemotaxis protein
VAFHLEELVTGLGCRIAGTAMRVPQALKLCQTLRAGLGLLDINVAGELCYPVADLLLARRIPVVFITGYEHVEPGYQHVPIIQKPVTTDGLAAAMTTALAPQAGF